VESLRAQIDALDPAREFLLWFQTKLAEDQFMHSLFCLSGEL